MAYTTQAYIEARLNSAELINLLDDDGDGSIDDGLLDAVIANVSKDIDGQLANVYTVPFSSPYPAMVVSSATLLVCYELYRRRLNYKETNPFQSDYDRVWKQLDAIRKGDESLDIDFPREFPMGAVTGRNTIYAGGVFNVGATPTNSM
jgi:phage gp36-like protein